MKTISLECSEKTTRAPCSLSKCKAKVRDISYPSHLDGGQRLLSVTLLNAHVHIIGAVVDVLRT